MILLIQTSIVWMIGLTGKLYIPIIIVYKFNVKLFIFVVAKLKWFRAELDESRKAYSRAEVLLMIERYVKAQQIADTYVLLNHPDY